MSNVLAVATITAALEQRLNDALDRDVPGSTITLKNPADVNPKTGPQVSLFLYRTEPNAEFRNQALPARGSDGSVRLAPQVAINLYYLLSFFGDERDFEPSRMLASTLTAIGAYPMITPSDIDAAILANPVLIGSDLAAGPVRAQVSHVDLSVEDLTRLWSALVQDRYVLSVAIQAAAVVLEAPLPSHKPLPVKERTLTVLPTIRPRLDAVKSLNSDGVLWRDDLSAVGAGLGGAGVLVEIGGHTLTPTVAADTEVRFRLDGLAIDAISPGWHSARVLRIADLAGSPHTLSASNAVSLAVAPQLTNLGERSGEIRVEVSPRLSAGQRIVAWLNGPLGSVRIDGEIDGIEAVFSTAGVDADAWLFRIEVDGVDSLLVWDATGPIGPIVTVP